MNNTLMLMYLISFISFYVIGTGALLILYRKRMIDDLIYKRFLVKRGWGWIRINGNDHRVREYFKDLKKEKVSINGHCYMLDSKKCKFQGTAGLYEFKEGIAEPIDIYSEELIGTDSEYLDGFLLKMKSLARITAAKEMRWIFLICLGAAIAAGIAAVLAFTNYNYLTELSKLGKQAYSAAKQGGVLPGLK